MASETCQLHESEQTDRIVFSERDRDLVVNAAPKLSTAAYATNKNDHGWRYIVRNFTPSWFSVIMGTGVVSVLFYSFPYKADWLYYLSIILFILNLVLFTAALGVSLLRYILWPEIWVVMIQDATQSLFLGCFPMAFATLIQMFVFVCVPHWGHGAAWFAYAMWILDAVVSVVITVTLSILVMSESHQHSLHTITALQILPIAATVIASGTGAKVAYVLPDQLVSMGTIIACYVLWGISVPMALLVNVIYYQRLVLYKIPPREVIVSCFLPLGPLGFGGHTALYLGKVAAIVFPATGAIDPLAGPVAYVLGFLVCLVLWGFGLVWLFLALAAIYKARPFPFNMGWWGFTFPLGVYSVSTIWLGNELPSRFFKILGTVLGTIVIALWILVAMATVRGAWLGKLFFAPCLAKLEPPPLSVPDRGSSEEETQREEPRVSATSTGLELKPETPG